KMYGAVWCSHCQAQKKLFGSAFKLINYVECTTDAQKCIDAKIESYPTWTFADGNRLVGEQSFESLAKAASCPVPNIQTK
ncbi:MAG: hypothetical protein WC797_02050, partial [Candidatus Paceibacterota bacterium]